MAQEPFYIQYRNQEKIEDADGRPQEKHFKYVKDVKDLLVYR